MKCEMCGADISSLIIEIFNMDESDGVWQYPIDEQEFGAVCVDVPPRWTGNDLSEAEQMDTISCPVCRKFPFKHREVQAYDFIRIVCFKTDEGGPLNA